jgi:hypothetical protein
MSSVQKTLLLVGILIIIGVGAFVYFDPLDLDLLGLKQKPAAAKPAIPHVASSKAVAPPPPMKAPVAAPSPAPSPAPAATPPVAAPKAAEASTQAKTPAAPTSPAPSPTAVPAATPAAPTPVAAAVQAPQPPMKLSEETKTTGESKTAEPRTASKPAPGKPERPKNLDLRHCLELETDAAIAKCAGE